jgi:two-component system chemotaxis response regulator CheB
VAKKKQRVGPVRAFGRDGDSAPGELSELGCPDCTGVLAVRALGDGGHLAFQCRVGHAYSAESLIEGKEEQLESALWIAIELSEEVAVLHTELALRAQRSGRRDTATRYVARAGRARRAAKAIREVIGHDGPAVQGSDQKRGRR